MIDMAIHSLELQIEKTKKFYQDNRANGIIVDLETRAFVTNIEVLIEAYQQLKQINARLEAEVMALRDFKLREAME